MTAAFADCFIKLVVALRRAELRDIAHAEAADRFGDELEFAHRHQIQRAHGHQRALRLGIEGPDRFQRVAEEVEPHGLVQARRKQIEDAAAHGIFAGLAHRRRHARNRWLQPRHHASMSTWLPGAPKRLRLDQFGGRNALQQRIDGGEDDGAVRLLCQRDHRRQRIEAPRGRVSRVRRGQAIPCRQFQPGRARQTTTPR
jgi:hypothetical protein